MKALITAALIAISTICQAETLQQEVVRLRAEVKRLKTQVVKLDKGKTSKVEEYNNKIKEKLLILNNERNKVNSLLRRVVGYRSTSKKNKVKRYRKRIKDIDKEIKYYKARLK